LRYFNKEKLINFFSSFLRFLVKIHATRIKGYAIPLEGLDEDEY